MNRLRSKQRSNIMPAASIAITEADVGTFATTSMVTEEGQVRKFTQGTCEECVLLASTNTCRIVDPQLAVMFSSVNASVRSLLALRRGMGLVIWTDQEIKQR
jgi:hypothetical protein